MSSDLYVFDESLFLHSSPEMVPSDADMQFYSDQFSAFPESDSPMIDALLAASADNKPNPETSFDDPHFLDQFITGLPPSYQMENLSLYQSTQLQSASNGSNLGNGYGDSSGLEVKAEDFQMDFGDQSTFGPHSYSGGENVAKMMQRSFSSNYFDREKTGFCFQPRFDSVVESPNVQNQAMSSPENSFLAGHLRRVCSTGDLQNIRTIQMTQRSLSSPLAAESSFMEDPSFKVGRYSAEERKERILKYRAKRNQRNFNKTIKYACRKTLADNRPRIRGRFARNDETGETPKASCSTRDEEDDEFLLDGLLEEEHGHGAFMGLGGGQFMNNHYGQTQFQYYGY